jgi:hypothetical protein
MTAGQEKSPRMGRVRKIRKAILSRVYPGSHASDRQLDDRELQRLDDVMDQVIDNGLADDLHRR